MNMINSQQQAVPGLPAEAQTASGNAGTATTQADGSQPVTPTGSGGGGGFSPIFMLGLVGVMIFMIFVSGGAQRKEKKKKAELLATMKKHDRVQTIGGIIGTVSEIRDDEIVLVIDDQNKTKLRMAKSAVQQVLREAPGSAEAVSTSSEPDLAVQSVS